MSEVYVPTEVLHALAAAFAAGGLQQSHDDGSAFREWLSSDEGTVALSEINRVYDEMYY